MQRRTAAVRRCCAWHTLLRVICCSMHAVNSACQAGGSFKRCTRNCPESQVDLWWCVHVLLYCHEALLHLWAALCLQCMSSHVWPIGFQCNLPYLTHRDLESTQLHHCKHQGYLHLCILSGPLCIGFLSAGACRVVCNSH